VRLSQSVRRWLAALLLPVLAAVPVVASAVCSPAQRKEAVLAQANVEPLIQAQNWDQAIPRLLSIVEICDDYEPAFRALGDAYLATNQLELAVRSYQQVIAVRGDEVEAPDYANLAKALAKQKKYKEARAEYIKAQKLAPDDCGVLFNLGVLHMASGFTIQAVEALEHAEEVCPRLRDNILPQLTKACNLAAEQQRKIGNVEKADYYAKLAQEYGGSAGGSTAYNLAAKAMNQKNFAEAASLFEKVIAENPDNANAWLNKARAEDALDNKSAAVTSYREYLKLKPDNLREVVSLVLVQVEAGQCQAAEATASSAVAEHEAMGARALAKLRFAWGKALECAERYEEAKSQFAVAANAGDPEWASRARQEITRMDQYIAYEKKKKEKAAQGG
jgi:tetratricopeptide (TPR) repeat protein